MAKNPLLDFLNGYEAPEAKAGGRTGVGKKFFSRSFSGSMTQKMKRIKEGRLAKIGEALSEAVSFTSAKAYGALFLTFGILTLILHFMKDYLGMYTEAPTVSLIIGVAFSIAAIPLLLVDSPIAVMLQDFALTDFIFFEFFRIKRVYYKGDERAVPIPIAVMLGIILAIVGYFVPVWYVAAGIGALIFLRVALSSPEFAFFSSLLLLPYLYIIPHSTMVLSLLVVIAVLSFLRKAFFGKRVIFFEQYDALLLIMSLSILLSGTFIKGISSFADAVVMTVMSFGYFLAGNTVTNRRLADCALNAVVVSSVPASFISVFEFIMMLSRGEGWSGSSSTYSSEDVAAVFLIVAICFAAALVKESHRAGVRAAYASILALDLFALLLTGEIFALFALLIGVGAYFALKAGGWTVILLSILFLAPYGALLLPTDVFDAVFALVPTLVGKEELLELWRASGRAFADNLFFGIGIGGESFTEEMANVGIGGVTDSSNLFIEIGLEAGIFALVAFALLIFVRLRHRAAYQPYVKHSQVSTLAPIVAVSIFCLLSFGAFDYVWSDMAAFYLFWCVFGIGSASLRVAKREHDERVLYFVDTRDLDSSDVSIQIK